jgi:hypothetical protein
MHCFAIESIDADVRIARGCFLDGHGQALRAARVILTSPRAKGVEPI